MLSRNVFPYGGISRYTKSDKTSHSQPCIYRKRYKNSVRLYLPKSVCPAKANPKTQEEYRNACILPHDTVTAPCYQPAETIPLTLGGI